MGCGCKRVKQPITNNFPVQVQYTGPTTQNLVGPASGYQYGYHESGDVLTIYASDLLADQQAGTNLFSEII